MDTAPPSPATPGKTEGLRDRKRRETMQRIAETGLRLFMENGFEATTLDAIAAAAGIARRTFFYYFKSKEDVLLAWQGSGFVEAIGPALLQEPTDQSPLAAARHCLLTLTARFETKASIAADTLLRSTETLRARKLAKMVDMERDLAQVMAERWPDRAAEELRVAAMLAIGALRLAQEEWRLDHAAHPDTARPLAEHLKATFALLDRQVPSTA
ncbi:TetR/AcrR family transcriptional regulator [Nitrospirillum amazonense]|uniref:TetR family transcriptional regulator n=1 Tax=Nitrospirillum amazonense TaxID=28077 RepID=A0A560JVV8_9PROT|nr:TetR/AcrR family transcriptional regulator [Nitrospirillum amazonense]MDG3440472.1 TetR/AcrR family transcriptional regulator [Nitrospirillum amazonense]TWB75191.1 TetR family transcriptional regulator [Nitrospirillum amazonense]